MERLKNSIAISVEYSGKVYMGNYNHCDAVQEKELKDFISNVNKTRGTIEIQCGNVLMFFPEKVLSESIIGLVYAPNLTKR